MQLFTFIVSSPMETSSGTDAENETAANIINNKMSAYFTFIISLLLFYPPLIFKPLIENLFMHDIPANHPRKASLETRGQLVKGFEQGIVCIPGLIAHGRGEAFDYIFGEKTNHFAQKAIEASASLLLLAKKPVISVNGNVAALCPGEVVQLASLCGAEIEVNLFYRTPERMEAIKKALFAAGARRVLGGEEDEAIIPELFSERRRVSREGIYSADVVLVPLEDGDRTTALKKIGKKVIAIDLNPLSVTAKAADITIVDNVIRALPALCTAVNQLKPKEKHTLEQILAGYNNNMVLGEALEAISLRMKELARR